MGTTRIRGLAGIEADDSAVCDIDGERGILRYAATASRSWRRCRSSTWWRWWWMASFRKRRAARARAGAGRSARAAGRGARRYGTACAVDPPHDRAAGGPSTAGRAGGQGSPAPRPPLRAARALARAVREDPDHGGGMGPPRQRAHSIAPDPSRGLHADFLRMLHGQPPEPREVEILDVTQILQLEHGFNASTFAGRVVASTLAPCR